MYFNEDPTTTKQLTDALQRANAELVKYKNIAYNLQQKVDNLTLAFTVSDSYHQLELETAKSPMSQQWSAHLNKPVSLLSA